MPPLAIPSHRALLLALAFFAPGLCACVQECEFKPHCEGNVVMDCEYGVDQLVGSGSPVVYPCGEPTPLCTARREGANIPGSATSFFCARSPLTPCDGSFPTTCEGTLLVYCAGGYVSAQECTNDPGTGRCGRRRADGPLQCL